MKRKANGFHLIPDQCHLSVPMSRDIVVDIINVLISKGTSLSTHFYLCLVSNILLLLIPYSYSYLVPFSRVIVIKLFRKS